VTIRPLGRSPVQRLGHLLLHRRRRIAVEGRRLAVAGICFALSGTIAVVFYEVLLRLEK